MNTTLQPVILHRTGSQSLPFSFDRYVDAQRHRLVVDTADTEPERKESQ